MSRGIAANGVSILIALPLLVSLSAFSRQSWADTQPPEPDAFSREPLEKLGDPPGIPARPIPGAPRSEPVRFGVFSAIQVNVDANGANIPGDAANEPSIAVNPLRPNSIAIGWRQFDTVASNFRQAGRGHSSDGGRTWTFPGVLNPGVFRSDPVLGFDQDGGFYYSSLKQNFLIDMYTSTDNGVTWPQSVPAFGGDKQWIAIDRTDGIGSGNLYQAWSTAAGCCGNRIFTRSTDGAQTFMQPITIPNTPVWGTLDVESDGTLYQCGTTFGSSFYVLRSTNAQNPGATPSFQAVTVDLGGSLGSSVGPNPGGLSGQLWIAVDPSNGPTAGWIYVLASVNPAGIDPMDVHFSRSTDGGVSWSPWVKVNDDPAGENRWQWFGTMSVAPTGRIDAVWNDTRDIGMVNWSALYYSYSTDGGFTWSANERISEHWDSFLGWPNQNKIGDYYHMISDAVGAHLAWAATFNGEQDVYYTRIGDYDCNGNGIPDTVDISQGHSSDLNQNGIPDECEEEATVVEEGGAPAPVHVLLDRNVPNPFNPSTTIRFDPGQAGVRARLAIFDARGRFVRELFDGVAGAGARAVTWDGRDGTGHKLPSGVYYYQLESAGSSVTRTMVLIK